MFQDLNISLYKKTENLKMGFRNMAGFNYLKLWQCRTYLQLRQNYHIITLITLININQWKLQEIAWFHHTKFY